MTHTAMNSMSAFARWRIVVLLMGITALGHLNREGFAIVGNEVFIRKLGLSEVEMGWVYSTFLIVYTLGMLPGGWLIDRIGSGRTLALFCLSMGTLVVLTGSLGGLSSAPMNLWIGLLLLRGVTGACNSPLHPGAAHVATDVASEHHQPTVNGLRTAGALLGIAFSYHIFGWLMDRLAWPWVFVVSGSTLIGCGLLWSLFATPKLPLPQRDASEVGTKLDWDDKVRVLKDSNLWLVTLSYAAYGYFQYLFFYWMDYYFKKVLQVSDADSRQASFWIFLAMGAGMAIGGYCTGVASKWFGTLNGRRSIVMTGMILGALFALIAVQKTDHGSVAVCLAISMGALGMCEGVFWTTATDIGGPARGFAGAFMNTGGNVGGFISPVLTPWMADTDRLGWTGAIAVACGINALGGLLWFVIRPPSQTRENAA